VSAIEPEHRRRRPPPRRGPGVVGVLVAAALVLLAFVVGLALGRALEEGPDPGGTVTAVRTLRPVPLPPVTETVTVTNR
jgi:hypothetical protein